MKMKSLTFSRIQAKIVPVAKGHGSLLARRVQDDTCV